MTPTTESTPLGTDSTQVRPPVAPPPLRKFPLMPLIVFGVIIAGGAGGFVLWYHRGPDPIQEAEKTIVEEHKDDLEAAKAQQKDEFDLNRGKCQQAIAKGEKVLDLLTEFDQELKKWDDSVVALLTNDRGKALAGNPDHIPQFRKLFQHRRPTKADGDAIRARVSALLERPYAALAAERNTYRPGKEVLEDLEAAQNTVEDMIKQYRDARTDIEGLVTGDQRLGKRAAVTLEQAIKDIDAANADKLARAVATAEAAAQEEADQAIVNARVAMIRQKAEDQKKQIEEEQKLAAAQAESQRKITAASREAEEKRGVTEAARIREETEKREKTLLAQSSEVKSLLAPFTAEGYWQPGVEVGQSTDKKPVSLSKLRSFGALQDSPEGLQQLLTAGTGPYHRDLEDKVRPRWPWPSLMNALKPDQLDQLKKAQKCLRDLDTTLVELKMLSE